MTLRCFHRPMGRLAALACLLLLGAPGASAGPQGPPAPEDLRAELLQDDSILLTWVEPIEGLEFNVYRDGVLLDTVDTPSYVDLEPGVVSTYSITSVLNGEEGSSSTSAMTAHPSGGWVSTSMLTAYFGGFYDIDLQGGTTAPGPDCMPVLVTIAPDTAPFVFVALKDRCLPIPPLLP